LSETLTLKLTLKLISNPNLRIEFIFLISPVIAVPSRKYLLAGRHKFERF